MKHSCPKQMGFTILWNTQLQDYGWVLQFRTYDCIILVQFPTHCPSQSLHCLFFFVIRNIISLRREHNNTRDKLSTGLAILGKQLNKDTWH